VEPKFYFSPALYMYLPVSTEDKFVEFFFKKIETLTSWLYLYHASSKLSTWSYKRDRDRDVMLQDCRGDTDCQGMSGILSVK